ncbi:hypothetical protein DFQ30_003311 [Apophysomyces sp. BC1015]|nr:hypothetical protein DFQ30_003311 [Apophysomyces sp. BC1015]
MKQLGIGIRTAQRWVKQYGEQGDAVFQSRKKIGRKPLLNEEHKKVISAFVGDDAHRTVVEVSEHLEKNFPDLQVSRSDMNCETNCVFLDEAALHIHMRCSRGWFVKGTRAQSQTPTTRAVTTFILGAISGSGLINVCVRSTEGY